MPSKRLVAIAATLCATVLLAGCGDNEVSSEELNKQVQASFEEQSGVELKTIDCNGVKAEVGEAISCTATNEIGIDLKILGKVTAYDSDADRIKFDWRVTSAKAPGENYANSARVALRKQSGATVSKVSCPEKIELEEGIRVACTAIDSMGNERELILTLTDANGGFDVKLKSLNAGS